MKSFLLIPFLILMTKISSFGQAFEIPADTAMLDIGKLTQHILPGPNASTFNKVSAVVTWTNAHFEWTYTDYKRRTVKETICRKGGNCNEQARVVSALLTEAGIKTRRISEINIQPESQRRQESAEQKIKEAGFRMSVFGFRHNDHVWIEYFDENLQRWEPADPTLNLVGLDAWVKARAGFGQRISHAILPSRDMLAPIAVFALQPDGTILENRTQHYLLEAFDQVHAHVLSACPAWSEWKSGILDLNPMCQQAFEGRVNLHDFSDKIKKVLEDYQSIRTWYIDRHEPWIPFESGLKPELMILGTFHFRDAGKDGYKPRFSFDVLSDQRQKEVEDLVNTLAFYKPTKIAVEWKKDENQPFLDSVYQEYLQGRYTLGQNEVYQVLFRLGKKLGHTKLYCVDAPARWYEGIPDDSSFAAQFHQARYDDSTFNQKYFSLYQRQDSLKTQQTLKDHLRTINSDAADFLFHGHYLIGSFKYAAAGQYPGADNLTAWYNRNLRIFANLLQLAERPDDKIFLMIGHGHLPVLRQAAKSTPEIKFTDVSEYLKE